MTTATTTPNSPLAQAIDPKSEAARKAERWACIQWTSFILLLLGGSVGMWIYAAVLAVSDPTMAVVPDYHEKALQWDKHLETMRASQAIGWTIAVVPQPDPAQPGHYQLALFLRDRDVRPVVGATGSLRYYHHARGKQVQTVSLSETEPGTYVAKTDLQRLGTWQLEVTLERDKEHFEQGIEFQLAE